jgi:methyl-accepting chemotaxis protein
MKLKFKLFISLLLLIIVPLITGIGVTFFTIRNSINNIDEKKAYSNLDSVSNYMNFIVNNHSNAYLTYTPWDDFYNAIQQKDTGWIKDNISTSIKEDTNNEVIIVINSDGSILSAFNAPSEWGHINFKDFNLYKKFTDKTPCVAGLEMTSDGLYIVSMAKVVKTSDVNFTSIGGYVLYARKVKNSVTTNGNLVKGLIEQGKDIIGVDITLKLDNGITISTSNNSMSVNLKSSNLKNNEVILNKETLKNSIIIQTEKVLTDGGNKPIGVLSVDTVSTAGVVALNTLFYSSVLLVIILIVLVIILCSLIISTNVKPLKIMISEFDKIASGDLTEASEGNPLQKYFNKKDEIGDFSRAFNVMKLNLRNTILSINKSVGVVSETSKTLSHIANNTNEASNETAIAIDSMAHEATKQSDYSISIYKMMEETQEYIHKGTAELSTSVGSINRARNIANKSNQSMEEATDYVDVMSESLNKSSASINELKRHSKEIGSIVTTIKGITKQTNLLALNASIEASRAGEQGKGFAVVANEIKKLSEESNNETKHIEDLIKNILSETDSTVKTIEDNLNAFGKQVELIKSGAIGLSEVVENINQTEGNSMQIQNIFGTIKKYVDDTFINVKKITDSITDSAKDSEQLSASTEEQLSIIAQLTQSANDLSGLSKELENETTKFKM